MIIAHLSEKTSGVEARLTSLGARLAASRLKALALKRREDGSHWRDPRLLWPLFQKDR